MSKEAYKNHLWGGLSALTALVVFIPGMFPKAAVDCAFGASLIA
jgi:hypothetical protein